MPATPLASLTMRSCSSVRLRGTPQRAVALEWEAMKGLVARAAASQNPVAFKWDRSRIMPLS